MMNQVYSNVSFVEAKLTSIKFMYVDVHYVPDLGCSWLQVTPVDFPPWCDVGNHDVAQGVGGLHRDIIRLNLSKCGLGVWQMGLGSWKPPP